MNKLKEFLIESLRIPSPTYSEAVKTAFFKEVVMQTRPHLQCLECDGSVIFKDEIDGSKPTIALIGHSDVVPRHFEPYEKDGKIYGPGASDMHGGLIALMHLFLQDYEALSKRFNVLLIIYAREENTPLEENGLFSLINNFSEYFGVVDLAIVGEPTNNTIQMGCVGSLHAKVVFYGKEAHSARPWDGENALYKALPFIENAAQFKPKEHIVESLSFYDVMTITESETDAGRTTIPGKWSCNVNFRFAPVREIIEAEDEFKEVLIKWGACIQDIDVFSRAPAGKVLRSEFVEAFIQECAVPVEAKQAWTDVAQLTSIGVPAVNFGPGLTAQAHKPNEYILWEDVDYYYQLLRSVLADG